MDWEGGRGNSSHYKGTFAERAPGRLGGGVYLVQDVIVWAVLIS